MPVYAPLSTGNLRVTSNLSNYRFPKINRKPNHGYSQQKLVIRFLCTLCGKTHSKLPNNFLPIIRWKMEHIQLIQFRLQNGHSIYAISISLSVSRAAIRNLKKWLTIAPPIILRITLAEGLIETPPLKEILPVKLALPSTGNLPPKPHTNHPIQKLLLTKLMPSWQAFAFTFSRSFYPKRFSLSPPHIILTG